MDLTINLGSRATGGLTLANPVMIASGTYGYDGYGRGFGDDAPLASLGAVLPKNLHA